MPHNDLDPPTITAPKNVTGIAGTNHTKIVQIAIAIKTIILMLNMSK